MSYLLKDITVGDSPSDQYWVSGIGGVSFRPTGSQSQPTWARNLQSSK